MLPSSANEASVQCPRCERVFTPMDSLSFAVKTAASAPPQCPSSSLDDHELLPQSTSLLVKVHPPAGQWLVHGTMLLLAATSIPLLIWAYSELEAMEMRAEIRAQVGMPIVDGRWTEHHRFTASVQSWIQMTALPALAAFMIWSVVAAHNTRSLHATGFMPWQVFIVGFFCIPGLNVLAAYVNLQDVWRASDPTEIDGPTTWRKVPASWWIRAWGVVVLSVPLQIVVAVQAASAGHHTLESYLGMSAILSVVVSNLLLIGIIRSINLRQQERYHRLCEDLA
jgi:hypothetical protein